ncbi:MAG: insulinase family protein, partial [Casimicrobium sp.]
VLKPDAELTARTEAQEKAMLADIKTKLTPDDVQQILQDAATLQAQQDAEQNLDVLPTLELSDVPMRFEDVSHRIEKIHGATVGFFAQPTQGLTYVDISLDSSGLSDDLKALLPVFAFAMTKMGAGNSDYLDMARRIEANTGGISANAGFRVAPDDLERVRQAFSVNLKTLNRNLEPSFEILRDELTALTFDRAHLRNLLAMYRAGLEQRVLGAGHVYAIRLAEAQLSPLGAIRERFEGISHVRLARELAALDEAGFERLVGQFEAIKTHLFRAGEARVCITADEDQIQDLQERITKLLGAMPSAAPSSSSVLPNPAPHQFVGRSTAVPVAFDAMVFNTVPYTHPDAPALLALGEYLRARYTHKE